MNYSARMKHPEERVGSQLLGKWHIDALLGVGAVGAVFAATHRNGRRVAIKMMHRHQADSERTVSRFVREGYAANLVGHAAVVGAFDDDVSEDGCPFLVLDLVQGEPLGELLTRRGPMAWSRVLDVADQLLDALAAAHDKGVLHRDLKPENLVLTAEGTLRILDFGIARIDTNDDDVRLTVRGFAMGTPGFMAPEQARGMWEQVDPRTDLWAVGATMFALLTGRDVHIESNVHKMLIAAMTRPAPPLREVVPEAPASVADIVDRALHFERDARFPSARAMQDAIRAAMLEEPETWTDEHEAVELEEPREPLSDAPVAAPVEPPSSSAGPPRWLQRSAPWLAAGGLAFAAFGATRELWPTERDAHVRQGVVLVESALPHMLPASISVAAATAQQARELRAAIDGRARSAADSNAVNPNAANPDAVNPDAVNPDAVNPESQASGFDSATPDAELLSGSRRTGR
jgi:serine/threonine-protein kinase